MPRGCPPAKDRPCLPNYCQKGPVLCSSAVIRCGRGLIIGKDQHRPQFVLAANVSIPATLPHATPIRFCPRSAGGHRAGRAHWPAVCLSARDVSGICMGRLRNPAGLEQRLRMRSKAGALFRRAERDMFLHQLSTGSDDGRVPA